MKDILSFRLYLSFLCALLSLSSIIVLSLCDSYDSSNNVLLSQLSLQMPKIIQAAYATSSLHYTATIITNVQLPGIIPNNNNNNSAYVFPSNSTSASHLNSSPPQPIIHNTRAPTAIGGPTLNDPNLKVLTLLCTMLMACVILLEWILIL